MRKLTLTATIATGLFAAIALTGCSAAGPDAGSTSTPAATQSASPKAGDQGSSKPRTDEREGSKSGTDVRAVAGVADVTGKCVDGESTPIQDGKQISVGDCDLVDVMGSKNTVTAGVVKQLTIEGDGNTVTVEAATEVTTVGKDNTVIYKGGDEPAFNEHASGNKVIPSSAAK